MRCYTSLNHWSNLEIKKDQIVALMEYRAQVIEELVTNGILVRSAADKLPMVIVMDCWPVNTSLALRDWIAATYNSGPVPKLVIRYVPANLTSQGQLGDTHVQLPFHRGYEEGYQDDFRKLTVELSDERERGEISAEEFDASYRSLSSLPVLRHKSIGWVAKGIQNAIDLKVLEAGL